MPTIYKRLKTELASYLKFGDSYQKVPEFLDYHLKQVLQNGLSYLRDSGHFLEEIEGVGEIS